MKVTYLKSTDPYCEDYSDNDIVVEDVHSLDDSTLMNLLQEILATVNHPNRKQFKQTATEVVKHNFGLITSGEAKTLDALKVKGNTFLFPLGGFGYEHIKIGKDDGITDYTLEKIVKMSVEPECYIQVEIPKNIQDKIDAHKVKLEKDKKSKERREKERQLEKARKILEKAGEKV
jgi:hypothetical protein